MASLHLCSDVPGVGTGLCDPADRPGVWTGPVLGLGGPDAARLRGLSGIPGVRPLQRQPGRLRGGPDVRLDGGFLVSNTHFSLSF